MKKLILSTCAVLVSFTAFSQTLISNKGDRVNSDDLKVEPWRVVGGTDKATTNTQNIYQTGNVGIGNNNPTEKLQVGGLVKAQDFIVDRSVYNSSGLLEDRWLRVAEGMNSSFMRFSITADGYNATKGIVEGSLSATYPTYGDGFVNKWPLRLNMNINQHVEYDSEIGNTNQSTFVKAVRIVFDQLGGSSKKYYLEILVGKMRDAQSFNFTFKAHHMSGFTLYPTITEVPADVTANNNGVLMYKDKTLDITNSRFVVANGAISADLNGNVGINTTTPTLKFQVNGTAGGTSAWTTTSDARLKTNIQDIQSGLDKIMQLHPVSYDKKSSLNSSDYAMHEDGFIAQELRKVIPSVVIEDKSKDKLLSVAYSGLVPVLTKAVQEQKAQYDTLLEQVKKMDAENELLKKRLSALEEAIKK